MADTKKVTDEVKGLFTKSIQGQIHLFNRLSRLAVEATQEVFSGKNRNPLPSVGEGLTRLVEWNLACWSAAANHSLAFANDLTNAGAKALGLDDHTPVAAHKPGKSKSKAKSKAKA